MINQEKQIEAYWRRKEKYAQYNMQKALKENSGILIEVAAQYPLNEFSLPNPEFTKRLDVCIDIYNKLKKQGKLVKIYVCGSRHLSNEGIADKISLSQGGINYLVSKGVKKYDIFPAIVNEYYTDNHGVYTSGDESKVACGLFFDFEFAELWTLCSPYQIMRKTLNSIEFGVIPKMYSVPMDHHHHSCMNELFINIPNTLFDDPAWQNPFKDAFINSRISRKPGFKKQYEKLKKEIE